MILTGLVCGVWGMKLNASKTNTLVVSRSCTICYESTLFALTLDEIELKESADFVILGVPYDAKMTLEKHNRSFSRAVAQRLGIIRMSWQVFHDRSLLLI